MTREPIQVESSQKWLLALACFLGAVAATAVAAVPFSTPMPDFWRDALEFAATGHIGSVFTPDGYPLLLGAAFHVGGKAAVVALQVLFYALVVFSVYRILRLLGAGKAWSALGTALTGLHPDLLISIKKIWDTEITAALLMLTVLAALDGMRNGFTLIRVSTLGLLWGVGIAVRPNFPALLLPLAFALWVSIAPGKHTAGNRRRTSLVNGIIVIACAAAMVMVLNTVAHGSFYLPENGPYNFFAGENSYTRHALLADLNAESSIHQAMRAGGFSADVNLYSPDLRPYYMHHGLLYIREEPQESLTLVFWKLTTLLRPDTKVHILRSLGGIPKLLEALSVPFWLLCIIASRDQGWRRQDWLIVLFVIAYVVPFLLTNSDPRFRVALDILVLTHALYRFNLLFQKPFRTASRWQSFAGPPLSLR